MTTQIDGVLKKWAKRAEHYLREHKNVMLSDEMALELYDALQQANKGIAELKWLLQNEPSDDLGSYTQVMRQKWNKRRDKALAK